jgi:hypothetical protein
MITRMVRLPLPNCDDGLRPVAAEGNRRRDRPQPGGVACSRS